MSSLNIAALEEKFLSRSATGRYDDCWYWLGCVQSNGYGRMKVKGKTDFAHRWAYRVFRGETPKGLDVCHTCDNRQCVNPAHLFLGIRLENMQDCKAKGRHSHGPAHAAKISGERGPGAKLTTKQVKEIISCRRDGLTPAKIAERFGVDPSTIRNILSGRTWKGVLK